MIIVKNSSFFVPYFRNFTNHNLRHFRRFASLQRANSDHVTSESSSVGDNIDLPSKSTDSLGKSSTSSIVLRKPVSTTFIRDTLLPHIEHSVTFDAHKIPPHLLIQLAIAYSKLPHFLIQKNVADRIIDTFIYRISDYGPSDCVQILNTSLQIQGVRNLNIYEVTIKRLQNPHIQNQLNTLNKLGIARTLSKLIIKLRHLTGGDLTDDKTGFNENNHASKGGDGRELVNKNQNIFAPSSGYYNIDQDIVNISLLKPWTIIQKTMQKSKASKSIDLIANYTSDFIIPSLVFELESHHPPELSAILGTIADNSIRDNTRSDLPIIVLLVSTILKKYSQTSLLHNIANISSLCKLRVFHPSYFQLVENDLNDKYKSRNLYHKHLARIIWVFSRYGRVDRILPSLQQQIIDNLSKFDSRDFARLCQSLPKSSDVITRLAVKLSSNIYTIPPRDFMFYYIGCIYGRLFENTKLLDVCNKYLQDKNEEFDLVDIHRIVAAVNELKRSDLLELFPKEWSEIINNVTKKS